MGLINQNGIWHAELTIPKDVRIYFGKRKFRKSMKTRDFKEAERKAQLHISGWKEHIALARGENLGIKEYRDMYESASDEGKEALEEMFQDIVVDEYGGTHASQLSSTQLKNSQEAYRLMTGKETNTNICLQEWLNQYSVKPKTKNTGSSYVSQLVEQFPLISQITRKSVKAWYTHLQEQEGFKAKTIKSRNSYSRVYWRYLQDRGYVDENNNPFDNIQIKDANKDSGWVEFTPLELERIYEHLQTISNKEPQLLNLFLLACYTGARIEELCSLKVEQVADDYLEIKDAKTKAGNRQVPIHSQIESLIKSMITDSNDGYLISGMKVRNKYNKRSDPIGKRFGRMKKELGFGKDKVFHSIRKSVATALENAGIAENIAADILGHEKKTMTYGIYSGGTSLSVKRQAIEKIKLVTY